MSKEQPSTRLLDLMRRMCERPGMYLVGAPDYRSINISIMWALITGYETALADLGLPSQERPFREWVLERRPDFRESSLWYGARLLQELDGDHEGVVAQIGQWLEEYGRFANRT